MKTSASGFGSRGAAIALPFATCAAVLSACGGNSDWCDPDNKWNPPPSRFSGMSLLAGDQCGSCGGSVDGTGSLARFNGAEGIASDGKGNFYVAENAGSTIRRISAQGVVTTFAGQAGQPGSVDAGGSAARFRNPTRLAVDIGGNVYVTDTGNSTIRRISPDGAVVTLAGQPGVCGSGDGSGAQALFCNPKGVAVDGSGILYVADTRNNTIRRITPAGQVITFAGKPGVCGSADGGVAVATFCHPSDITVDHWNNIYVADTDNNTIRMIDPGGHVTTLAGAAGSCASVDGPNGASRLCAPDGVTVDSTDNLYVADTGNDTIRRIDVGNVTTTVAGLPRQKGIVLGPLPGELDAPTGITVDTDASVVLTSHNLALRLLPAK